MVNNDRYIRYSRCLIPAIATAGSIYAGLNKDIWVAAFFGGLAVGTGLWTLIAAQEELTGRAQPKPPKPLSKNKTAYPSPE